MLTAALVTPNVSVPAVRISLWTFLEVKPHLFCGVEASFVLACLLSTTCDIKFFAVWGYVCLIYLDIVLTASAVL